MRQKEIRIPAFVEVSRADAATGEKAKVFRSFDDLTADELASEIRRRRGRGETARAMFKLGCERFGDPFARLFIGDLRLVSEPQ
jgi:hypothetical protein